MAHLGDKIIRLMNARRAVINALAQEDYVDNTWATVVTWDRVMSDAEEQIVATYVLALMTYDVADATDRGPT